VFHFELFSFWWLACKISKAKRKISFAQLSRVVFFHSSFLAIDNELSNYSAQNWRVPLGHGVLAVTRLEFVVAFG
jgi:hypothetical protein